MAKAVRGKNYDPHIDPERVGPIGVARFALEFFAAADATDDILGDEYSYNAPTIVIFLMGRSLELSFKAFLIHKGVSLSHIKTKIGHDLERGLAEAEVVGLMEIVALSGEERGLICVLNATYKVKQLEYFVRGATEHPIYGDLQKVCKRVLSAVIKEIPNAHGLLRSRAGMIFESIQM